MAGEKINLNNVWKVATHKVLLMLKLLWLLL